MTVTRTQTFFASALLLPFLATAQTSPAADVKADIGIEVFAIHETILPAKEAEPAAQENPPAQEILETVKKAGGWLSKVPGNPFGGGSRSSPVPKVLTPSTAPPPPPIATDRITDPGRADRIVRDVESFYLAQRLQTMLQQSNNFGVVRVLPGPSRAFDYVVRTTIMRSDGDACAFDAQVFCIWDNYTQKVGRVNVKDCTYHTTAADYAGEEDPATKALKIKGDPYDGALKLIADAIVAIIDESRTPIADIKAITQLTYAQEMAPDAFQEYSIERQQKRFRFDGYKVTGMPNPANPFFQQAMKVRAFELMALDTINRHYEAAAAGTREPYFFWRRDTREAMKTYQQIRAEKAKVMAEARNQLLAKYGLQAIDLAARGGLDTDAERKAFLAWLGTELLRGTEKADAGFVMIPTSWPKVEILVETNQMYGLRDRLKLEDERLREQQSRIAEIGEGFAQSSEPVSLTLFDTSRDFTGRFDQMFADYRSALHEMYLQEVKGTVATVE